MPRKCTVCAHPERERIDRLLAEGLESFQAISNQIARNRMDAPSPQALQRHSKHLPAQLSCAAGAAEVARASTLLERIRALEADAQRLQRLAETAGDLRTATACVRESLRILELLAKLSGELESGARVNVLITNASGVAEPQLLPHELRALARSLASEQLTPSELRELALDLEAVTTDGHTLRAAPAAYAPGNPGGQLSNRTPPELVS